MWEALREATDEEMEKDPTVCVMGIVVSWINNASRLLHPHCSLPSDRCAANQSARLQCAADKMHLDLTSLVYARPTNDIIYHCRCFRSVDTRQTCSSNTDKDKWAAGEDVGHYGGSYKVTYDLYKKYGDMRLLDTPICGRNSQYLASSPRPASNIRDGLIPTMPALASCVHM